MSKMERIPILEKFLGKEIASCYFEKIWEKKTCFIPSEVSHVSPDFSFELFLDFILTTRHIKQSLRVFNLGNLVNHETYISGSPYDGNGAQYIDINPQKLIAHIESGNTILYQQIDRYFRPLRLLCASLQEELGQHVSMNAYFSPPNAQGFLPHWDTHDVFILQIDGYKEWFFGHEPTRILPQSHEKSPDIRIEDMSWDTKTLAPNNILYLPRGYVHYAKTSSTSSLHLTIGVKGQNWSEFMHQMIDKAAKAHPELRQSMRPEQILRDEDKIDTIKRLSRFLGSST